MAPNGPQTAEAPGLDLNLNTNPHANPAPAGVLSPAQKAAALQRFYGRMQSPKEKGRRNGRTRPGGSPFKPLPTTARRLVVADPELSLSDELWLLAALEALKRQDGTAKVQLTYATWRPDVYRMLGKPWFLSRLLLASDPALSGQDDAVEWVPAPDYAAATAAEADAFQQLQAHRLKLYEAQREALARRGIQAPNLEAPEAEFAPGWHRSQAHVWNAGRQLRVAFQIPESCLAPYAQLRPTALRAYQQALERTGIGTEPFVLYDFTGEEDPDALRAALQEAFPGAHLYAGSEIVDRVQLLYREDREPDGHGLSGLIAALAHRHCFMAVGPVGDLVHLAWGAGTPAVLTLYRGAEPRWDGIYCDQPFMLNWEHFQEAEKPRALAAAGRSLLAKLVGA